MPLWSTQPLFVPMAERVAAITSLSSLTRLSWLSLSPQDEAELVAVATTAGSMVGSSLQELELVLWLPTQRDTSLGLVHLASVRGVHRLRVHLLQPAC